MKKGIIVLGLVILTACGTTKVITQADADRGGIKYPGMTLAELQQGKIDYEQNCGTCHGLKKPTSKFPEQWQKIVPDMVGRAHKAGKAPISAAKEASILKYLVTMSMK
jgi:mono/diheme cytochrome c family protein